MELTISKKGITLEPLCRTSHNNVMHIYSL